MIAPGWSADLMMKLSSDCIGLMAAGLEPQSAQQAAIRHPGCKCVLCFADLCI